MKRKGLLLVTDCAGARLDTLAARKQLPFGTEPGKWSDYTLEDAFRLRLMLDAAEVVDVSTASYLAQRTDRFFASPLGYTGDRDLWLGVAFYTFTDKPEDWDGRYLLHGRSEDLMPQAEEFIDGLAEGARIIGVVSVNASSAARRVREVAAEIGLPEALEFPAIPEDLTGFPAWFVEAETRRREALGLKETDQ